MVPHQRPVMLWCTSPTLTACQGSSLSQRGRVVSPSPSAPACCPRELQEQVLCSLLMEGENVAVLHSMTTRHLAAGEAAWVLGRSPSVCWGLIGTTGPCMLMRFLISVTQQRHWGRSGHRSKQKHKECYPRPLEGSCWFSVLPKWLVRYALVAKRGL